MPGREPKQRGVRGVRARDRLRHVTERTPRAQDFPGAPPENLIAGGVVFSPPNRAVPLDQYCSRYMVGTRGKGEVSTGTNHLGFRCVKDTRNLTP